VRTLEARTALGCFAGKRTAPFNLTAASAIKVAVSLYLSAITKTYSSLLSSHFVERRHSIRTQLNRCKLASAQD
jgi:hypothetical protein